MTLRTLGGGGSATVTQNTVTTASTAQTLVKGDNWLTLTAASCAITLPASPAKGDELFVQYKQDGTGSRLVTYVDTIKWPMDVAPTLQTTAAATDQRAFKWDGSFWHGRVLGSYSA